MRVSKICMLLLISTALVLSSCSRPVGSEPPAGNLLTVENSETAPPSSDGNIMDDPSRWPVIDGIDTNYVKLDDINPEAIPEIKFASDVNISGGIIREIDGGFICASMKGVSEHIYSDVIKFKPKACKISETGSIIWEKEYDFITEKGRVNNLIACPDGGFLFSVSSYPFYDGSGFDFEKSFIVKCDGQGNVIWEKDFDNYSGELLHSLFITENEEIIAAGQWRTVNGKQSMEGADDIVVTRLDKDGNILKQKVFGGSDFDSLYSALYDKGLGIVIDGRSQSKDGDFAIDKDESGRDFIACIDKDLDLKWVCFAGEKESFSYDRLVIDDGYIYVPGGTIRTGIPSTVFLIKLDEAGNRVWTKTDIFSGYWGGGAAILQNGDVAIGSVGKLNQGEIAILDRDGNVKKRLEGLKFAISTITPVQDGGFIVTSRREIKTIPQPPYISSIWYDTELVAVKYRSDYSIEWMKTYDKYKDKLDMDFALPLEDGRIIVEG